MIQLSLPYFYKNNFYYFFREFVNLYPEKTKLPFHISSLYGSFPYSIWNGGINSNENDLMLYPEIAAIINAATIPIRLDCSNLLLNEFDLYDRHMNVILKLAESNGTLIEIADLALYNYIKENYIGFNFILSNNANYLHEFNEEIINTFTEQSDFFSISLLNINSLDLSKIIHKNKIEIILNNKCQNCSYDQQKECRLLEHNNQLIYSNKSILRSCNQIQNDILSSNLIKNIEYYQSLGFHQFKIKSYFSFNDAQHFNQYLILSLIKPEYQLECENFIEKKLILLSRKN